MIEDMAIRKLGAKTQHDYVQRVKDFAVFLGRSPDKASKEDVRRFQLHLSESGAHTPKINATVSALRFFFDVTLDRADLGRSCARSIISSKPSRTPRRLLDTRRACRARRSSSRISSARMVRHGGKPMPAM